jgi:transposase
MDETGSLSRAHYFRLLDSLCRQIDELQEWLEKKADNVSVKLLMTQKGVGCLTALTVVHTLGDITRFTKVSKQVVGLAGFAPASLSTRTSRADRRPLRREVEELL